MSVYLLSWNPKHFSTDGDTSGKLNYKTGETVRWSCHSQQPKLGDTIYLVRVGVEPRGIVAKGTVSKESYAAEHWSDPTKQKRYIDFKLDSLRTNCDQGLLSMMLLQGAMPKQNWSPQTSGVEVQLEYFDKLSNLWEAGSGKHSLTQFFDWYLDNEFDPNGWYKSYVETCELVNRIQNGKQLSEQDVKTIWYDRINGIASLGQGNMYKTEFEANEQYLQLLTSQILEQPTEETYNKIIDEWKSVGDFNRTLWSVIHRVFAAAAPDKFTSIVGVDYIKEVFACLNKQYQVTASRQSSWLADNTELLQKTDAFLPKDIDDQTRNILLWSLFEWKANDKQDTSSDDEVRDGQANYINSSEDEIKLNVPLNQIMYGPPGTGKTYHTIEAAVKAAEPEFYHQLNIDPRSGADKEQRAKLQRKYQQLCDSKRIRFVTFHQSYGYEEFVEGLTANAADGQVSYEVKPGIFKTICDQAIRGIEQDNDPLEIAISALKSELEEGVSLSLTTQRGKAFDIQYHGNTTFRAFPHETSHEDLGNGYPVAIDSIRKLYRGGDAREFYNPSYVKAILKYLTTNYDLSETPITSEQDSKNFVLVIDEINRGNISKIFGELITLIEPSKRKGEKEALELTLPHSGEAFSVPNNLHIIGTMNTADRSLALMDTALRRRFDFIEMMPKPELLACEPVNGVDLQRLLEVLNQRIEILYDREHTLGHAYFIPVKELAQAGKQQQAFEELVSVFKNKVIPLLEEYFFDDWNKIRLVLADNQKPKDLQFVKEQIQTSQELNSLFGNKHNLDQYGQSVVKYTLASDAAGVWAKPNAYVGIYQGVEEASETETQSQTDDSRELETES